MNTPSQTQPDRALATPQSRDDFVALDACWRAANYLSAAQLYLRDNPLLQRPLTPADIKPRLLGHWGTTPGLNFIYTHLNRVIRQRDANVVFVTGPGHGAPAVLAQSYLEGSYRERYPDLGEGVEGLHRFLRQFSWPHGIPSHAAPNVPGSFHEGGELGYALAHAFGAAFDNPDLIVACVVGDGEAESGPCAASWHANKWLNPATDGAVLPVLHLNGYKIANPTILARIPEEELLALFRGYGYAPRIVAADDPQAAHPLMAAALDAAFDAIAAIQATARKAHAQGRTPDRPAWPMLILRTPKGWTGPHEVDGEPVENTWRAHQVPLDEVRENPSHLAQLEGWLRSYRPEELFDAQGWLRIGTEGLMPSGERRMGANPHANGGVLLQSLTLPELTASAVPVVSGRGQTLTGATSVLGKWLREVFRANAEARNFRLFSPDENASNRLSAVYAATGKTWLAGTLPVDRDLSTEGRVMEVLSEHLCEGWLEGYLLTGRHGLFSCYEAFVQIVASMLNQHAKWMQSANAVPWRAPIASLNLLLTSHVWRQDHNGSSHQEPGLLDLIANKPPELARLYLPADANTLLCVAHDCLASRQRINVIVAGKQPEPVWLDLAEARAHVDRGASIWEWAGQPDNPNVILACAGDVPTLETLAAVTVLRELAPALRVRVVNVVNLFALRPEAEHPDGLADARFDALFTPDRPVIFAFHGYPTLVHRLIYRRSDPERFHVHGYRGEGSTTTPFDMCVQNQLDRFSLARDAIRRSGFFEGEALDAALEEIARRLLRHREHVEGEGEDLEEIKGWRWTG